MAYTSVPTLTTGHLLTAAEWNAYVKDNFAAGVPDIFTTKGDIAVASAADAAGRLGVGANDTLLTAASGETLGVKWSSLGEKAYARYQANSTTTIANNTTVIINFAAVSYDTDTAVTTGAAWKFTVPADHAGYYLVAAMVMLESYAGWVAGETMELAVFKGGVQAGVIARYTFPAAATANVALSGGQILYLDAAEYIDIRVYQNSGADLNAVADGTWNHVSIAKLF